MKRTTSGSMPGTSRTTAPAIGNYFVEYWLYCKGDETLAASRSAILGAIDGQFL